jgi:GNAT superfamily N-acetyltransferase
MKREKSNFARYYEERIGGRCFEDDAGFICYRVMPEAKEVVIDELFVHRDYRRTEVGRSLVRVAAVDGKEKGCDLMSCNVMTAAKTSGVALQSALADGFRIVSATGGVITLVKEIA